MKSGLRGDPDAHWNLILPQIICYIVVLKVLKFVTKLCYKKDANIPYSPIHNKDLILQSASKTFGTH